MSFWNKDNANCTREKTSSIVIRTNSPNMLSSKSLRIANKCFFPGLVEHLEFVGVQPNGEEVVQIHHMTIGLVDAKEREDPIHSLPVCNHGGEGEVLTLNMFVLREVDIFLKSVKNNLHDSLDDLRIKNFILHIVLVEREP